MNELLQRQVLNKKKVIYPVPAIAGSKNIIPISNSVSLFNESVRQHNCVWSYHDKIMAGGYFIYQVLQPERVTLGIMLDEDGCMVLDQLLLQANEDVSEPTEKNVQRWFEGELQGISTF